MSLTESYMMLPAASVSGFCFSHPESKYFAVGRIGPDQIADYAARRGEIAEEAERAVKDSLAERQGGMRMKSALIVWGGWEGHEPRKSRSSSPGYCGARGFEVELSESLDPFEDEKRLGVVSIYSAGLGRWARFPKTNLRESSPRSPEASG